MNCGECLMNKAEMVEISSEGICPSCGTDYGKPTDEPTDEETTFAADLAELAFGETLAYVDEEIPPEDVRALGQALGESFPDPAALLDGGTLPGDTSGVLYPKCCECKQPFDDNPGASMCQTCADWIVTDGIPLPEDEEDTN